MTRVSELPQFGGREAAHEPEYNKFENRGVGRRLFINWKSALGALPFDS